MRLYCEHQKHEEDAEAYDEALQKDPIVFYGGPYDGFHAFYRGLIIRFPEHPDGAYCFDGVIYRWLSYNRPANNSVNKKE